LTNRKHRRIALFVPHQGCPKDCVFCDQSRITGKKREERLTPEQVRQTIEEHLQTIEQDVYIEIAFFGGSFTGLPRSYQKMLLEIAKEYVDLGAVQGIRFSTRPDYITKPIMEFLIGYGVTAIELGTQSLDDNVLQLSQRGHTAAQVHQAVHIIREYPSVQVGLQLLPGLPGDSRELVMETVRQAIHMKPDFVRIYPALVIAGTELEWMYRTKQYIPLSLDEAIALCAEMWVELMREGIPVIRLGLHSSDDLRAHGTIVAGPFHPSFRQLVEMHLFEKLLHKVIRVYSANGVEFLQIHPADETSLRGIRGGHWRAFQQACSPSQPKLLFNREVARHQVWLTTRDGAVHKHALAELESS